MKKNNFLKEASVLFITIFIVSSASVSATDRMENQENHPSIQNTVMEGDHGYYLFIQLPHAPENPDKNVYTSDSYSMYKVYDDFWDISSPICDIHWWGHSCYWDGCMWHPCDPDCMTFDIEFYEEDGSGMPGTLVCSYDDVMPSINATGMIWIFGHDWEYNLEVYYFEYDLDPCCELSNGWVSIQSTYCPSGCTFRWVTSPDGNDIAYQYDELNFSWDPCPDLSFILSDGGEEPLPDLDCDGELSWTDVKPGDTVTGDFVVRNNGDPDSILHWKVESYPNWGSNWTFTPNASVLTIGAGWITVDVEVIAPDDPNKEFTGEVKLVNVMDSTDYCEIDVVLKTPYNKPLDFNFNLLSWLFERFPNAFPILRYMLRL